MSRYDWPAAAAAEEERDDDPRERGRHTARLRSEFDHEAARLVRSALPPPPGPGPGRGAAALRAPRAPATSNRHLWQPLGPLTVIGGQAAGAPRITGRVNALAVHPLGERLYAATANGGVWYSNDGALSWRSLAGLAVTELAGITRPAHRNACGAITVDWGLGEGADVVWVGTGEATHSNDAQPGRSLGGVGILRAEHPATSVDVDPWKREANNLTGHGIFKIAREPGGAGAVAASTKGLFFRPATGAGPGVDWVRSTATPFSNLAVRCTDVLWTAAHGAAPARLWAWVKTASGDVGLWVRDSAGAGPHTDFVQVAITGAGAYFPRRGALAALALPAPTDPPTPAQPQAQVWVINDAGDSVPPRLFRIGNAGAAAPTAELVAGAPDMLSNQGFYDIAIDVHPAGPNHVVLGGATLTTTTEEGVKLTQEGGIAVGDVAVKAGALTFGHPTAFTMLGIGVHADLHGLYYALGGNRLFACHDGGVSRSDRPTRPAGFFACNEGLQVVESNYIAQHPQCEGYVATGLQDNSTIQRHSSSVWTRVPRASGDGGGLVLRPLKPQHVVFQFNRAKWDSSDGALVPDSLLTRNKKKADDEFKKSAFYSSAAAIAHTRRPPAPAPARAVGQLIVGTTRLWYTEETRLLTPAAKETEIGRTWVTLPKGTDPLPADTDATQDAFGEAIRVCRWQSPDVAWVLGEGRLVRYFRTPGSDAGGGVGTWDRKTIIQRGLTDDVDGSTALGPLRASLTWTDVAVNLDPPANAGEAPRGHGTDGAVYLGTIGDPDDDTVDTLWWYDGDGKWHATGLRTDPKGSPAAVTAIVCDPAFPDEVYVGTTVGAWKGLRKQVGAAAPTWDWESRLNGLPEAAVEDLALFNDGSTDGGGNALRLLRAGIAARGVWELRLDVEAPADLTYLRAHDNDMRYRPRATPLQRDTRTTRSWHGSPDVRPRTATVAMPAPGNLPFSGGNFDAARLRRFQAALRANSGDPRVRATGTWDAYFSEVLRDLGAPIVNLPQAAPKPALKVPTISKAFWNTHMNAAPTAEPWFPAPRPSEADLLEFTPALQEGDVKQTSCAVSRRASKVEIVVHHRGFATRAGTDVRVTLLKWIDPKTTKAAKWSDSKTWFIGPVPWTAAVNEVLNSAGGDTALTFDQGWSFVGTSVATRRQDLGAQQLDALHPGVASFDLDLSAVKKDAVVLLVAVMRAGADIALTAMTLQDLAMTSPNAAVRSVRVTA